MLLHFQKKKHFTDEYGCLPQGFFFTMSDSIFLSLDYYIIGVLEAMIEIIPFFHLLHFYLEEVDPIFTTMKDL